MDIVCPITLNIFHTPMIASDGFTYENQAIIEWLEVKDISPVTKEPIEKRIYPSILMQQYIQDYLDKHPEEKEHQYTPSMTHMYNLNIINRYIKSDDFNKLLNYTNYDLSKLNLERLFQNCKNIDILQYIIDNSIDLECEDCDKWKPIHYICYHSVHEIIKYIIDKNVDLECQTKLGSRPINFLCQKQQLDSIKYLMNKNVSIYHQNNNGRTSLHAACRYNTIDVIKFLINLNFDQTIKAKYYESNNYISNKYLPVELLDFNDKLSVEEKNELKLLMPIESTCTIH